MTVQNEQSEWPPVIGKGIHEDRKVRQKAEADAKKASEAIDKDLEQERARRKKRNGAKILLLGQAESGKSTVLKNFQLYFAPKAFQKDVELWRPVIHLNLVRSINFVVTFVTSDTPASEHEPARATLLSSELREVCSRLELLREVEEKLIALLSGRLVPIKAQRRGLPDKGPDSPPASPLASEVDDGIVIPQEIAFPSNGGWKLNFTSLTSQRNSLESSSSNQSSQMAKTLMSAADDMVTAWNDQSIQEMLHMEGIRLDEQPGFFLDQIKRIATDSYVPEAGDILKARVTTFGAEEHTILVESGPDSGREWTIYDVGGSRTQRAVWAQFFDDVHAIIFMAPMSGFNQVLAEDETVNRLTDSLRIWQSICSNPLLQNVEFILFLNKLDLLEIKLSSGIRFSSFATSYTGKNEAKPVAKYLREVFTTLHQQYSPRKRKLHSHLTCAVNKKTTRAIISEIKEQVLLKLVRDTHIIG